MDFVKSPEDMLRFWGVIDYVPHLTLKERSKFSGKLIDSDGKPLSGKTLDDVFAGKMDQRKRRAITGTMAEINDAVGGNFGIDVMELHSRYMSAAKAISGQEFMFSLISGGVLKIIGPKSVYDNMLEHLADKYKLFSIDIDNVLPEVLSSVVRAKASKAELALLDEAMAKVGVLAEVVPGAQRASDLGYVPIFSKAVPELSNDLIINGSKSDWAKEGLVPESILEKFASIANYPKERRADAFAKFIRESPAIRNSDEIISVVASIKAKNFADGVELFNPVLRQSSIVSEELAKRMKLLKIKGKSVDEISSALTKMRPKIEEDAWNTIALEMNKMMVVQGMPNRVKNGDALKDFYAQGQEVWKLYIPGAVKQSMDNLFIESEFAKNLGVKGLKDFNNFWKVRVTIVAIAFHTRNFVSNQFSQILDTGFATFNPTIAVDAGRLSTLSHVYDRYGSISAARKVMSMKRGGAETSSQFFIRKQKLKILNSLDTKNASYDLGDGIGRTADEAIYILRERGVVAGGMQQYIDIENFESGLADLYASAGYVGRITSTIKSLKKSDKAYKRAAGKTLNASKALLQNLEDGLIVGSPMIMTGMSVPIGIPKGIGSTIGRSIENQARISSFIANVNKTRSFDTAAAHVNKFLFNYSDLTQVQKSWMRLLIPFFTWTQKNVLLQIEMMQKNPAFYANFSRLLVHQGPEIVERYNSETLGIPYVPKYGSSKQALALRDEHARNYVSFPVPGQPGHYVEGLGLPQEAFFEQVEMIHQLKGFFKDERFDKKKQHLRMLGQTHYILKTIYEVALEKRSTFMDMPISEMTHGRQALEQINLVRSVPIVGNTMAEALLEKAGVYVSQPFNTKKGMLMDDVLINGTVNYALNSHPWSRVLKDASAVSMLYNMTYLDRMPANMRGKYSSLEYEPLPDVWKFLDAMGGVRIIADNPEARKARQDYDIKQRYKEAFKRVGITDSFPIETIKEQK